MDESRYGAALGQAMVEKSGGIGWLLADSDLVRDAKAQIPDQSMWFQRVQTTGMMRTAVHGNTISEVARKAGIDAAGLHETIDAHNTAAASGQPDPMGKPSDFVRPILTAPFTMYDVSIKPNMMNPCPMLTLGGLVVDESTGAVKNEAGQSILGLYAAGRTAVGICSNSYVSGLSLADCVFSGRRAGLHAASNAAVLRFSSPPASVHLGSNHDQGKCGDCRIGKYQHRSAVQTAAFGVAGAPVDDRNRPAERRIGARRRDGARDIRRRGRLVVESGGKTGPGVRSDLGLRAPRRRTTLQAAGIRAVDLTPAAVGPAVVPPANLREHLDAPNVNMITCGGQATIPIVYAVSRVVEVAYAEIVASVASLSAGPGTRANIDEFTKTTSRGIETIGGAQRGKAIIILNPADPPMIMRDTIFCAIPEDVDHAAITDSIHRVVKDIQQYVPGYRLLNEPQFDDPSVVSGGYATVTTFVEVEGAGDFLPPYAGNLDIMTAAATKVGEEIAQKFLSVKA